MMPTMSKMTRSHERRTGSSEKYSAPKATTMSGMEITTTISQSMRTASARCQKPAYSSALGELDQLLAKVLTLEERDEALRRVLQAFHHGLAVLQFPFRDIGGQRLERLAVAVLPVEHDHSLDADAVHQHRSPVLDGVRLLRVVIRDQPAHHQSREEIHLAQHTVQDLAADVVEIDVDTFRTGFLQRRGKIA